MSEMYESKKKKILEGSTEEGFDLMGECRPFLAFLTRRRYGLR